MRLLDAQGSEEQRAREVAELTGTVSLLQKQLFAEQNTGK